MSILVSISTQKARSVRLRSHFLWDALMHAGKLIFAKLTEYMPLTTFRRCVARYGGEHKIKRFTCLEQFLCLAFAQLTFRGIEACLCAHREKLYNMGIRSRISRSTLADANEVGDLRIYADFAQCLIGMARKLYANDSFGADLNSLRTMINYSSREVL
jgi:hypothetical protein